MEKFYLKPNLETREISKPVKILLVLLLVSAVLSFIALRALAQDFGLLKVYFLDVGQGDAIFIESPNDNQVLIDGGPDGSIINQLSKIMPPNDRTIDLLILSHPHADHLNGLLEVMKRYKVGKVLEGDVVYQTASYDEWQKQKRRVEVIQAQAGQLVDIGGGARIRILHPLTSDNAGLPVKNPHDFMVVSRLDYGEERLMLTGDMEAKVERKLIDSGADLKARLLKVGHHGSKTSSSENFLKAVDPEVAFISAGAKNLYGHPHKVVLDRLDNFGIKYYRTDIDGTVKLILDGRDYLIDE